MTKHYYEPKYNDSWALIIGINSYSQCPLEYARHDAEAIADVLETKFNFPAENITTLYDNNATKDKIMQEYLAFADKIKNKNDRLLIFFAGHGDTKEGSRGEVGYLIPVDATDSLASLIRWDDLTRNAELIPAKHILFIMDACYGGTALTRKIHSGSMRFIRDMLSRFSRQVITAGKADEVVADAGGPIPNHSVFTGHLLQALEGNASAKDGSLTANSVMSYVYEKVAKDTHSNQTPHFGFLDGDGDFIFKSPVLESDEETQGKGDDYLIEYPYGDSFINEVNKGATKDIADIVKEYISDDKYLIKLDDMVSLEVKRVLSIIQSKQFPLSGSINKEEFQERLNFYEELTENLVKISIVLGYWGREEHSKIAQKIFSRLCENIEDASGNVAKLCLRWYPSLLLFYAYGVASASSNNFHGLSAMMNSSINLRFEENKTIVKLIGESCLELNRTELFKILPDYERKYVPRSEYLFTCLQPYFDDILFAGKGYEQDFDKFELFFALVCAHYEYNEPHILPIWGPVGRFGWKGRRNDQIGKICLDFKRNNIIDYGFFDGSNERFELICKEYGEFLNRVTQGWI